jgi:hypothetical protein
MDGGTEWGLFHDLTVERHVPTVNDEFTYSLWREALN